MDKVMQALDRIEFHLKQADGTSACAAFYAEQAVRGLVKIARAQQRQIAAQGERIAKLEAGIKPEERFVLTEDGEAALWRAKSHAHEIKPVIA